MRYFFNNLEKEIVDKKGNSKKNKNIEIRSFVLQRRLTEIDLSPKNIGCFEDARYVAILRDQTKCFA